VGASIKVFDIIEKDTFFRDQLEANTHYFKKGIKALGFDIVDGDSAIVPIMLYDAPLAQKNGFRTFKRRGLCDWILLSCCSQRKSEDQGAALCSAQSIRPRPGS
jgi:7-keto-8-aminopelargonate synthetase-like enzyme